MVTAVEEGIEDDIEEEEEKEEGEVEVGGWCLFNLSA